MFYNRKSLRATSCSLYFRALSLNDLVVLYIFVLNQWLVEQRGIDPTVKATWYCKFKSFINTGLYTVSPYLVVLACFDRLCTSSTNVRLRRLASVRFASFLIPFTVVFVFVCYFHVLIWYEVILTPFFSICGVINATYSRVFPIFLIVFLGFLPPALMLIFCIITLILLRQQRRRIMPVNQNRVRQRDNQLIKMLFIYVMSHSICTLPFSISFLILIFHPGYYPTFIGLLFRCSILIFNLNFATSFYIYTMGTPFYRRELYSLMVTARNEFHKMIHKHRHRLPISPTNRS